jgi:hypothetical protein
MDWLPTANQPDHLDRIMYNIQLLNSFRRFFVHHQAKSPTVAKLGLRAEFIPSEIDDYRDLLFRYRLS